MKKLLLGLLLLFSVTSFSQALTDGSYWSNIEVTNSAGTKTYGYEFTVTNGIVKQKGVSASSVTKSLGNDTVFTWLNQGGIWTESQTYIFSKDAVSGQIYVHYMRVVQNEGEAPWWAIGNGLVNKD